MESRAGHQDSSNSVTSHRHIDEYYDKIRSPRRPVQYLKEYTSFSKNLSAVIPSNTSKFPERISSAANKEKTPGPGAYGSKITNHRTLHCHSLNPGSFSHSFRASITGAGRDNIVNSIGGIAYKYVSGPQSDPSVSGEKNPNRRRPITATGPGPQSYNTISAERATTGYRRPFSATLSSMPRRPSSKYEIGHASSKRLPFSYVTDKVGAKQSETTIHSLHNTKNKDRLDWVRATAGAGAPGAVNIPYKYISTFAAAPASHLTRAKRSFQIKTSKVPGPADYEVTVHQKDNWKRGATASVRSGVRRFANSSMLLSCS